MRVWIAQCLCPQRHCILGAADEAEDAVEANKIVDRLRRGVNMALATNILNPWCGLCDSPQSQWHFEIARTPFETMKDALPTLRAAEAEQAKEAAIFGDLHRKQRPN